MHIAPEIDVDEGLTISLRYDGFANWSGDSTGPMAQDRVLSRIADALKDAEFRVSRLKDADTAVRLTVERNATIRTI